MSYWLFKSEPNTFSIDDLAAKKNQVEPWDGIRNYQVRNMLRDQIKKGDQFFFYHSSCFLPGIVGIAEVVKDAYPDMTAFDPDSVYYDSRATLESPRWFCVGVKFVKKFSRIITLSELKQHPKLKDMLVLRKGNRLSITPITDIEWQTILALLD